MKKQFDFIIVGQGLAGSMLYWSLSIQKKTVFIIDQSNPSSSSNIAAGIIHPVTGRRIVKTWMADTLIPFADKTYSEIENHFREKLFNKRNILELIHSAKEINDWNTKIASEEMKGYFSDENTDQLYNDLLIDHPKKIAITRTGWLNISKMTGLFRKKHLEQDHLLEEDFDHDSLQLNTNGVLYKDIQAEKIIFCEGAAAIQNPFWKYLPFRPAKGEVLTIHSGQLKIEHILTKTIFILPLGENLFKVGSTYSWNETDERPTERAKEYLLAKLWQMINVPFEVVDHQAAIRPTVIDRRPFTGLHPEHKQVGIFNGLGTKGVLLAPYFSNHFSEYLVGKTELMKDVDVNRFEGTQG